MNKNDSAYDDLLSSIEKISPSENKEKKANGEFKLDIKGLDEEFSPSRPQRMANARGYRRTEPADRRKQSAVQKRPSAGRTTQSAKRETGKTAPTVYGRTPDAQRSANQQRRGQYSPINQAQQTATPKRRTGGANVAKKSGAKRKRKKFDFKAFIKERKNAILVVLVCTVIAILISSYTISCINDVLAIRRDSENIVTVNLPTSIDTNKAIDILKDNHLIKHKYFCMVFAKFMQYRDDNYLTGIYYLTPSMGLENMLSAFKEKPISGETVTLAFPEGYTIMQIADKLEKNEVCTAKSFYATIKSVDFSKEYSFIAELDNKSDRFQLLEGYLYPDTYEFYVGENAANVVRKFLDNFAKKWTKQYAEQAKKLNMSVDDVITLASLIEKEAYGSSQMPLVSSVFHNRLSKPGIYPTLQSNATSDYVNEYISKNVTDSTALTNYMENYSTYKCEGLPVGAICNPGNDAIHAALYPKDTNYNYFLHDNNKKIYLAETDAQHRANSIEALRANSSNKDDE